MTETAFEVDCLKNCMDEQVFAYRLPKPVDRAFEECVRCFGALKYPLGEGFSFIKLETKDFLLTGNVGLCELKLTIKRSAGSHIKEMFERELINYLKKGGEKYDNENIQVKRAGA